MAEIHSATSSPRAQEIVDDVLAEFDSWAVHCGDQNAAIHIDDTLGAARGALADMRAELMDHLVIRIGLTMASWELSG